MASFAPRLLPLQSTLKPACAILGALLATGCAQQTHLVDAQPLPLPSLDAPTVTAPPPTTRPVALAPIPVQTEPKSTKPDVPREWLPQAKANSWKWIVIHHSATPTGSAPVFDREHRSKGWDELGYHFVIGNGTASRDGQIEVGSRWPKQKWGAHAKTANQEYNNFGIGICLVGNFDLDRPTPAQTRALAKLVAHLMATYHIPAERVLGHGQTKPTDCPGRNISVAEIRRLASSQLALTRPDLTQTARPTGELLHAAR